MLGVIFRKAQNKFQDPAKLRRLIVDLIDKPGLLGRYVVEPVRRREGGRLRGVAAKERRGREGRLKYDIVLANPPFGKNRG